MDLYLTEYKIVIDCTDNNDYSELENEERSLFINKWLKIDDTYWIKYNKDINDVSKIVGEVLLLMKNKKKTIQRVCKKCGLYASREQISDIKFKLNQKERTRDDKNDDYLEWWWIR